ncbi:glycosyltransferase [Desulfovibrio sp. TomC]|uniref:glycosyltransferase n=1 Tax=Desulfovibrio sp. TomC TaxID=1562888 RepID=UPI0005759FC8|nr:glycosyltransferase [Desulfovibrio sp. TomC]KHK03334.1 putative glycosyltransferase [Desulfovibrio sp. TomC]
MAQTDLTVLFVHHDFPAQYRGLLGHYLRQPRVAVCAIRDAARANPIPGVIDAPYHGFGQAPADLNPLARHVEGQIRRGAAVMECAKKLRQSGVVPDLIYAHPGWGEALFLLDVFPDARLISYCEHYYDPRRADAVFDPEFPVPQYQWPLVRLQNTAGLLALAACSRGVSPTAWQRQGYPAEWQGKIKVIHEGVDTDAVRPDPAARLRLPGTGLTLAPGDEVVTYVARDLEPYRGFHIFLRALPELLRQRPNCRVLIIGRDDVSYGLRLPGGQTYRERYETSPPVDPGRVHFLGPLPYPDYLAALAVSACHVYLTYPFVLSWSALEAMAAGCLLVGSDTEPVREVVAHGINGFLTDFFDHEALAAQVAEALANRHGLASMRALARETVLTRYDRNRICLPAHLQLAEQVLNGDFDVPI